MVLPDSVVNGRFKSFERPNVAPGKCAVCGAVNKPVVDFGMTLDYYGAVQLCGDCISEAYLLLAATFPASVRQSQVVPLLSNTHLVDAGAINEYVSRSLDNISRLGIILSGIDIPTTEDAARVSADDSGDNAGAVESDEASDEPANEPRPYDIPEPTSGVFSNI